MSKDEISLSVALNRNTFCYPISHAQFLAENITNKFRAYFEVALFLDSKLDLLSSNNRLTRLENASGDFLDSFSHFHFEVVPLTTVLSFIRLLIGLSAKLADELR